MVIVEIPTLRWTGDGKRDGPVKPIMAQRIPTVASMARRAIPVGCLIERLASSVMGSAIRHFELARMPVLRFVHSHARAMD
jgi:hypothetical protein